MTAAPIAALASSLAALCREHGIEGGNSFTVEEIARGAGLMSRLAGRYIKSNRTALRDGLSAAIGAPVTLERKTGTDRRRYVVVAPDGAA